MMGWISVLALAAASQAEGAPAPLEKAPAVLAADADWAKRPSVEDLARFYPARASQAQISGDVALTCSVDRSGSLSACRVSSETPSGYGFGDAALSIAQTYMMRPERAAGWVTDERRVLVPIRFRTPEGQSLGPPPLPPGFVPRDGRVPLPKRERT